MKLYYFDPETYGDQFFVMAKNKQAAIKHVLNYLESNFKDLNFPNHYKEAWVKIKAGDTFVIKEFEEGEVIESEIS